MRAADKWDSARFWSFWLALGLYCAQTLSTLRPLAANAKPLGARVHFQGLDLRKPLNGEVYQCQGCSFAEILYGAMSLNNRTPCTHTSMHASIKNFWVQRVLLVSAVWSRARPQLRRKGC